MRTQPSSPSREKASNWAYATTAVKTSKPRNRPDYDTAQLWALAKATRDAGQRRRLLALAEIYDGGSRTRAARIGGVGLQTLRDWVVRFNERGARSCDWNDI